MVNNSFALIYKQMNIFMNSKGITTAIVLTSVFIQPGPIKYITSKNL